MLTRLPALLLIGMIAGCTPVRVITIRTSPPNARIRVDDQQLGPAPIEHRFVFRTEGEIFRVSAALPGYKEAVDTVTITNQRTEILLQLKRDTRQINIQVEPAPAIVKLDGVPLSPDRVSAISREIELGMDERNVPVQRVLTAERENFVTARRTISALDRDLAYVLTLEPMRKTVTINSNPPGADLYLDEEKAGTTPHTFTDLPFAVDLETDKFIPRHVRVEKRGYQQVVAPVGWDEGKTDYAIELPMLEKEVRLFVDPPGATISIDGEQVANDALGVTVRTLRFPPTNDQGDLKTYKVEIKKKTDRSEWETKSFTLAWEEGRTDYRVALKEILTLPVPQLSAVVRRGDRGWEMAPQTGQTIGTRDISEPVGRPQPRQITHLATGAQIDTLSIAPDGSQLVFTVLSNTSGFVSQMFLVNTDGSGAVKDLSDGKSLELMPSFSPDGAYVVFSSDRVGGRMQIWSISRTGTGRPTRLTNDNAHGLWPEIDSDPRPRLFRQAMVEGRVDPRVQVGAVGSTIAADLCEPGGTQPRVSLKNDAVLFCRVNEQTGKRDIYKVSDKGGEPVNLTNTPDVDECDPAWSRDGSHILYSADRSADDEGRRNYDIWVMDLSAPDKPVQITANGSVDDCPVFDVFGTSVFFRSNRGGQWAIWKIAIR